MSRKFFYSPLIPNTSVITSRLGAGNTTGDRWDDKELNKLVKASGDSAHDLCAVGDLIDGQVVGLEEATSDGWTIGSVQRGGRIKVIADGSQAAGTGSLAVGDFVVAGDPVAKGTSLGAAAYPKVRKGTIQPGVSAAADAAAVAGYVAAAMKAWKVVSLLGGNGSVGTTVLIERVHAPMGQ